MNRINLKLEDTTIRIIDGVKVLLTVMEETDEKMIIATSFFRSDLPIGTMDIKKEDYEK